MMGLSALKSNLSIRLLSAGIGIPILAAIIWSGGIVIAVASVIACFIAATEITRLITYAGWQPSSRFATAWAIVTTAAASFGGFAVIQACVGGLFVLMVVIRLLHGKSGVIRGAIFTTIPTVYIALPLATIILLRNGESGLQWLTLAFIATFATDTGAYVAGRLVGHHKLAPTISPSKTWEGALGGVVGGLIATIGIISSFDTLADHLGLSVALGFLIAVVSQLGDLLESKLKRKARVKDSGSMIPGHGGIMDRLDSLVPVFPVVYYFASAWPSG